MNLRETLEAVRDEKLPLQMLEQKKKKADYDRERIKNLSVEMKERRRKQGRDWYRNNVSKRKWNDEPTTKYETYGLKKTVFYSKWSGMIQRCTNPNDKAFKNYGGRGIECEWKTFKSFKDDMYASYIEHRLKYSDRETTIERVDVNGNYCKKNCIWADRKQQGKNRRNTRMLEFNGKILHLAEWERQTGIPNNTIHYRLAHGWTIERALTKRT